MFKNINSGTLFWFANFFRSRLFRLSRIDELVAWLAYWTTAKEKERSLSKDLTKKQKKKQTNSRYTKKFVGGLLSATVNSDIFKSWASIPN